MIVRLRTGRGYRGGEDFVQRLKGRISSVSVDQLRIVASLFRFGMSRRQFIALSDAGAVGAIGGPGLVYLMTQPDERSAQPDPRALWRTEPVVKIRLDGGAWMYTTLSSADGSRQAFDTKRAAIIDLPSRTISNLNDAEMESMSEIEDRRRYTIKVIPRGNSTPIQLKVDTPLVPWKFISTSAEEADRHLRLFQTAEELDRLRKRSGSEDEPIIILDWGAGTGHTLMQYANRLKKAGFNNVIYIAYGDEYYREWEEAPSDIIYILDVSYDLPLVLGEIFKDKNLPEGKGIDFIYSYFGLFHYMWFWETPDQTQKQEYPYHFDQLQAVLSQEGVLATYPRKNIEWIPAPGSSAEPIETLIRVELGIKRLGWKIGADPDTLILRRPSSSNSGLEERQDEPVTRRRFLEVGTKAATVGAITVGASGLLSAATQQLHTPQKSTGPLTLGKLVGEVRSILNRGVSDIRARLQRVDQVDNLNNTELFTALRNRMREAGYQEEQLLAIRTTTPAPDVAQLVNSIYIPPGREWSDRVAGRFQGRYAVMRELNQRGEADVIVVDELTPEGEREALLRKGKILLEVNGESAETLTPDLIDRLIEQGLIEPGLGTLIVIQSLTYLGFQDLVLIFA
jgi:hypothetical protein